jgi:hypothetical protein
MPHQVWMVAVSVEPHHAHFAVTSYKMNSCCIIQLFEILLSICFVQGYLVSVVSVWMQNSLKHHFPVPSILNCDGWSLTMLECLELCLQLAHSFWIVSIHHRPKPLVHHLLTSFDTHDFVELVLLGIYKWTCKCIFCKFAFLLRILLWKFAVELCSTLQK